MTDKAGAPRHTHPFPEQRRRDAPPNWTAAAWDLVRFCRGTLEPSPLPASTIRAIAQESFWQLVWQQQTLQPLLPLLYRRLQAASLLPSVPSDAQNILKGSYYAGLLWSDRLTTALHPVLDALAERDVPVILLKGMALAGGIFGDVGVRPMVDLDLLVHTRDLPQARAALHQLSYHVSPNPAGHPEPFDEEFGGELEMTCHDDQGAVLVDLHTQLIAIEWYRHASRLADVDALWAGARPLRDLHEHALELPPEDTLLALCVHLAVPEGFWGVVRRLLDVDWLIRRSSPPLDWDRLVARAEYFRARLPVFVCLQLARVVYDTPIPPDVTTRLHVPRWRVAAVQRLVNTQLAPSPTPIGRRAKYLLQILLVDDMRSLAAMLRHLFFPGRRWLAARYALQSPTRTLLYQFFHPLRVIALGLASLWQTRLASTNSVEEIRWN